MNPIEKAFKLKAARPRAQFPVVRTAQNGTLAGRDRYELGVAQSELQAVCSGRRRARRACRPLGWGVAQNVAARSAVNDRFIISHRARRCRSPWKRRSAPAAKQLSRALANSQGPFQRDRRGAFPLASNLLRKGPNRPPGKRARLFQHRSGC
jgi:hypothetical protein